MSLSSMVVGYFFRQRALVSSLRYCAVRSFAIIHVADSLYLDGGNSVYESSQIFSIILFIMAVPKRLRLMFDSICDGCLGGAVSICPMTGKWSESPAKRHGSESQAAHRHGQLYFAV